MWVPFASVLTASAAIVADPIAKTESGDVSGLILPSGVKAWQGIPFADSPPVRFAPAKPAKPWNTTLATTQAKSSCIQQFSGNPEANKFQQRILNTPAFPESEDCLYLNIWAPSKPAPPEGFPVFYWIYGGNLQAGHAGLPVYNGEGMAKNRDVVVVGANYRTNGRY